MLASATQKLIAAGIESAALDARLLLQHVLRLTAEKLLMRGETPLSPDEQAYYNALIVRRARREPLSHIVGMKEFWGRNFLVTPDVLTPRPDSETLIEAVLKALGTGDWGLGKPQSLMPNPHILDLGTGTGCLLLTLLAELPGATGLGLDVSHGALAVARENAARIELSERVEFTFSNWCGSLKTSEKSAKKAQIVVANPPYIASNEISALMPEVASYEPHLALDGGADGLEAYRRLAEELPPHLAQNALIVVEIGIGQHEAVSAIFHDKGFRVNAMADDLAGITRCIVFHGPQK